MTIKFRTISLSAGALVLSNPENPKHELRVNTKRTERTISATDTSLIRLDYSESLPLVITDGAGSKTVLENIRVGFTRYNAGDQAAVLAAWERVKANVDLILADKGLNAFTPTVELNATTV